ncbi:hypothetical protein CEXT_408951 [Caerostris extrusa]|uniref:Maturase K n=1 Tax=Caerostris extrusa TaxID=172846 RepID=A0AAV4NQS1_CAEEX|nr:hypothetical protein CEXT_408951 [Caerostris extrusa]
MSPGESVISRLLASHHTKKKFPFYDPLLARTDLSGALILSPVKSFQDSMRTGFLKPFLAGVDVFLHELTLRKDRFYSFFAFPFPEITLSRLSEFFRQCFLDRVSDRFSYILRNA